MLSEFSRDCQECCSHEKAEAWNLASVPTAIAPPTEGVCCQCELSFAFENSEGDVEVAG